MSNTMCGNTFKLTNWEEVIHGQFDLKDV